MPVMAKRKERTGQDGAEGESLKPISYRPSPDVARAMQEYRDRHKVKPAKSAILERALREFFRGEGIDIEVEEQDDG
jgi:hypothetical protein